MHQRCWTNKIFHDILDQKIRKMIIKNASQKYKKQKSVWHQCSALKVCSELQPWLHRSQILFSLSERVLEKPWTDLKCVPLAVLLRLNHFRFINNSTHSTCWSVSSLLQPERSEIRLTFSRISECLQKNKNYFYGWSHKILIQ